MNMSFHDQLIEYIINMEIMLDNYEFNITIL